MTWKIVKKGYSRSPWRIITERGQELESVCSETGIVMPVCGQTRAEVESWLLDRFQWYAKCAKAGVLPPTYSKSWRNTATVGNRAAVEDRLPEEDIVRGIEGQWGADHD